MEGEVVFSIPRNIDWALIPSGYLLYLVGIGVYRRAKRGYPKDRHIENPFTNDRSRSKEFQTRTMNAKIQLAIIDTVPGYSGNCAFTSYAVL